MLWFEFMVATLLSSQGEYDLRMLNPFLTQEDARKVCDLVVDALLHVIRLGQIRRCLSEARDLTAILEHLVKVFFHHHTMLNNSFTTTHPTNTTYTTQHTHVVCLGA